MFQLIVTQSHQLVMMCTLHRGAEILQTPRQAAADSDPVEPGQTQTINIGPCEGLLSQPKKCSNIIAHLKSIAWKHYRDLRKNGTRENLSRAQLNTLTGLSRDRDIVLIKPDKGNGVVCLDRTDYTEKMGNLLQDTSKFKALDGGTLSPCSGLLKLLTQREDKLGRFLKKLVTAKVISTTQASFMSSSGARPGILYGLPKVHKNNCPMRPILSASGTFNYNLAKFLVPLIKPFSENEYTVSDSFDFLKNISEI